MNDALKLIEIGHKIDSLMKDLEDVATLLDEQYQTLARRVMALELEMARHIDIEDPITPLGPNATP